MSNKYSICPQLWENTSIHCATIAVSESIINDGNGVKIGTPNSDSRNGTLTFIESGGKVFGITCWHVVDYLRRQIEKSGNPYSHSFFTMPVRPYVVVDSFIRPGSLTEYHELDIGIRQVKRDFVSEIGKKAINIDFQSIPDFLKFGIAVGFPEGLKYKKDVILENNSQIISLPTVSILAEIGDFPKEKFILYSEFENVDHHDSYSGMSGGPIMWSNENEYGIFGITYEASKCEGLGDGKSIMVAGELATPESIKHWISQIPQLYDDK
jgi:hypothetical protein